MEKMLTIKELSAKTGLSSYEIRRRVHDGTLPHMRVGVKQTKILINEDIFTQLIQEESYKNMQSIKNIPVSDTDYSIGYGRLRKID